MKQPRAELPAVAIGHVSLRVADPLHSAEFYKGLGLREILIRDDIAILELRGGTHLMLLRAKRKPKAAPVRSFDFMVDDIDKVRAQYVAVGVACGSLEEDRLGGHHWFEITDLDGHVIGVYSSHVGGRAV